MDIKKTKLMLGWLYKIASAGVCDFATLPYRHFKHDRNRIRDLWKNKAHHYFLKSLKIAALDLCVPATVAYGITTADPGYGIIKSVAYLAGSIYFMSFISADRKEKKTGFEPAPRLNKLLRDFFSRQVNRQDCQI